MKTLFYMILAAVAVALGGCETESSDQIAISISPNNVTMLEGESREFSASGWQDYTWTLAANNNDVIYGVLSNTKGDKTVFTALHDTAKTNGTVQQILLLTVNIPADDVTDPTITPENTGNLTSQALITITYSP